MKYRNVPLSKLNQIHFQVDGPTRLQSHQGAHNHMNAIPVRSKIKIVSQHITDERVPCKYLVPRPRAISMKMMNLPYL